jgi:hypothetical protein
LAYAVFDTTEDGVTSLPSIAASDSLQLAQAQPAQPPAPARPPAPPASPAAAPSASSDEPVGNVATLTGTASVVRDKNTMPLKLKDEIYLNDVVATSKDSTLGITFNDETTFNLTANSSVKIDDYVYEDGGKKNSAIFDVAKGTVAFVASAVAKTGDMRITTPTATLGIRGTTGLVEVDGAGSGAHNIKLYPDPDGRVGHIEVSDRRGNRLGSLTQGSSGFTIRAGAGGRITAAPLAISPQQATRDQGIVRQVHAAQNVGRQVVREQRALRRANPNRNNLRNPPGQRQNNLQPRPNGPQQPGQPNRAGQPGQPGERALPNRAGETRQGGQPGQSTAPNRAPERGQPPATERHPNAPALREGGQPNRGALQPRRPPPRGKPPKEKRR